MPYQKFPELRSILPKEWDVNLKCNLPELKEIVDIATMKNDIKFELENDTLKISAGNNDSNISKFKSELPIKLTDAINNYEQSFNPKLLKTLLDSHNGNETCFFRSTNQQKPAQIYCEYPGIDYQNIIMPLR